MPFVAGTPTMMNAQPPKRRRKGLMLVLLIILVIAAVGAYFGLKKSPSSTNNNSGGSSSAASSSQLASQLSMLAGSGSKLTAGDLGKFNKTSLFYAVFKNAAEQNVVSVTSDHYEGADAADQKMRSLEFLHQTTFNYKTKALAEETQDPAGGFIERCVNGKNYTYDNVNTMSWQAETGSTATCTDPSSYDTAINDGMNSGGLSAAQAQTFVSTLAGVSGLITVDSMTYATHDNAPYIRFAITVHPVKESDGSYQGMGVVLGAFAKTGIDSLTWPYQTAGSIATGAQFICYVNPTTQLPAYSQTGLTYYIDNSGKQQPNNTYTFQDTQYAFSGSVQPLSLTGAPAPLKLTWTEEKF